MNDRQRKVLCAGLVVMAVMGLFPPWVGTLNRGVLHLRKDAGYGIIWAPPRPLEDDSYSVEIDVGRLVIQWAVAALAVACGFMFAGLRRSAPKEPSPQETMASKRGLDNTPPPAVLTTTIENAEATATRRKYLKREAAVKSIGSLYYCFSFFYVLVAVALPAYEKQSVAIWIGMSFLVLLGAAFFWAGRGLRAIDAKSKPLATILAVLLLVACSWNLVDPLSKTRGGALLGFLISAYVLYVIHSAKGKVVFSKDYRAVIEATPSIRYRTALLIWILLGLLISVFVAAILSALFAK